MTSTVSPPTTLDLSAHRAPSFLTLVRVEMRKSYDTRAGFWLLVSTGLLTLVISGIMVAVGATSDMMKLTYSSFATGVSMGASVLLPVIGILLVTSEWSQRTAMTTFALTTSRARVISAKWVAGLVWALITAVYGLALGALANVVNGWLDGGAVWEFDWKGLVGFILMMVLAMTSGFALAALILNSPGAIVVYFVYSFVLPTIFQIGMVVSDFLFDVLPWIDFNQAQVPLIDLSFTGKAFAQFAVSGFIWLVLPLAFGIWRILRAEVK